MPAVTTKLERTKEDIRKGSRTGSPVSGSCQHAFCRLHIVCGAAHQDVMSHRRPSSHATAPALSAQCFLAYISQVTPSHLAIPSSISTTFYTAFLSASAPSSAVVHSLPALKSLSLSFVLPVACDTEGQEQGPEAPFSSKTPRHANSSPRV